MNNLVMLPIIIPFIFGAILIIIAKKHKLQRIVSAIGALLSLIVSIILMIAVYQDGILVVEAGDWEAPFGIVLVADMFATFMLLFASIIGTVCLFYAFRTIEPKREKYYFYAFYFFLMVGVNGAFITGDIFNLFVFFEVLLLSSYGLIAHGGTKYQLRESFKYVIINVFTSALFVIAVAWLYSVTGTLNMAHLAERVAEVEQTGVLNAIAIMFFIVFATKGALFPLYFWLPRSYFGPPAAIAALFGGLLTKVGIYANIRVFTLIFHHDIAFTHKQVFLIVGGLTMFLGVMGAVSQFDFKRILSYHIISQVGYMIMGLGIFTPLAIAGAIFYVAHNMIVKTALFLFEGATKKVTGTSDLREMGGLLKTHPWLAWLFFISGMAIAGIPPFTGFFSKLSLIIAGFQAEHYFVIGVAVLVGFFTLFSMIKIFRYAFWGEKKHSAEQAKIKIGDVLVTIVPLVALTIGMGLFAEPVFQYLLAVAEELLDPTIYIESVLKG